MISQLKHNYLRRIVLEKRCSYDYNISRIHSIGDKKMSNTKKYGKQIEYQNVRIELMILNLKRFV